MESPERVALITGDSRGLGLEIARLFAQRAMPLILTARGASALEEAAVTLRGLTEVVALPGDVADPAHAERLVRLGLQRFGKIDVLVNNASSIGPSPLPALDAYPLDSLEAVFRVNTIAPIRPQTPFTTSSMLPLREVNFLGAPAPRHIGHSDDFPSYVDFGSAHSTMHCRSRGLSGINSKGKEEEE